MIAPVRIRRNAHRESWQCGCGRIVHSNVAASGRCSECSKRARYEERVALGKRIAAQLVDHEYSIADIARGLGLIPQYGARCLAEFRLTESNPIAIGRK
jgi:hypothetical protein